MIQPLASLIGALLLFAANPGVQNQLAQPQSSHATLSVGGANLGGFSEVSALANDTDVIEYREGAQNHPIKITGMNKISDVTLKRGVVSEPSLFDWLQSKAARSAVLTVPSVGAAPTTFHLRNCKPVKYTGPPLGHGKGDSEVAIEELVLSCESVMITK